MALPEGVTGTHDPDFYEMTLRGILDADIPYDSVCFKDASGTATPVVVHETIKRVRRMLPREVKIVFHSHETAGICILQYKAALDAGADQVDLSMAPVSGGTCQPDVMVMYHALRGTEYTLGIDPKKVYEAEEVFKECMKDYFEPPESRTVEPLIPLSPMPGGALTANTQMLRDTNLLDRYEEITKNMAEVIIKGGYGTSVTPVSQFYFQQAFNNTMLGPWKKIADGYGKMVLGYFGKTPVAPHSEVIKIAQEQMHLEPTNRLVVDINDENPALGVEAAKKMLIDNDISELSEENIFIAATCLDKGIQFLKHKAKPNVRKKPTSKKGVTVTINGRSYGVKIDGNTANVNGKNYNIDIKDGIDAIIPTTAPAPTRHTADRPAAKPKPSAAGMENETISAPMPGLVLRIPVALGDRVKEGDEVVVLEAMKMETPVSATSDGTIGAILVKQGDQVKTGENLIRIDYEEQK